VSDKPVAVIDMTLAKAAAALLAVFRLAWPSDSG